LACAEGHFTAQLAGQVTHLIAADISARALSRAGERCASLRNVEFTRLDIARDNLPKSLDLVVCSEVLYYIAPGLLHAVARKLVEAIKPGGHLLMAHSKMVTEDRSRTGFD